MLEVNRSAQVVTTSAEEAKRIPTAQTVALDAVPGSENRMGLYIRVPVGADCGHYTV